MLPMRFSRPTLTVCYQPSLPAIYNFYYTALNDHEVLIFDPHEYGGTFELRILNLWTRSERKVADLPDTDGAELKVVKFSDGQRILIAYMSGWYAGHQFMVVNLNSNSQGYEVTEYHLPEPYYRVTDVPTRCALQLISSHDFRLILHYYADHFMITQISHYPNCQTKSLSLPDFSYTWCVSPNHKFWVQQRLCVFKTSGPYGDCSPDILCIIDPTTGRHKDTKITPDKYWRQPKLIHFLGFDMQLRSEQELMILCPNGKCPLHLALWRLCLKDIDNPKWTKMAVVPRPDLKEFQLRSFGVDQMLTVVYQMSNGASKIEQFALQPLKLSRIAQLALDKPTKAQSEEIISLTVILWWFCFSLMMNISLFSCIY